jgi:hypothetical protein
MFSKNWNAGYRAEIRRRLAADFTGWQHDDKKFNAQLEKCLRSTLVMPRHSVVPSP